MVVICAVIMYDCCGLEQPFYIQILALTLPVMPLHYC
jgi:hypothetical protein